MRRQSHTPSPPRSTSSITPSPSLSMPSQISGLDGASSLHASDGGPESLVPTPESPPPAASPSRPASRRAPMGPPHEQPATHRHPRMSVMRTMPGSRYHERALSEEPVPM